MNNKVIIPKLLAFCILQLFASCRKKAWDEFYDRHDLKAGTYKIVIEATGPYKDFVKEGMVVKDGEVPDLGNITLSK